MVLARLDEISQDFLLKPILNQSSAFHTSRTAIIPDLVQ